MGGGGERWNHQTKDSRTVEVIKGTVCDNGKSVVDI